MEEDNCQFCNPPKRKVKRNDESHSLGLIAGTGPAVGRDVFKKRRQN